MFVVFFLYGVGVWFFAGQWDILQNQKPAGHFDTLTDALVTLFQLLVGEGWHDVRYDAAFCFNSSSDLWS